MNKKKLGLFLANLILVQTTILTGTVSAQPLDVQAIPKEIINKNIDKQEASEFEKEELEGNILLPSKEINKQEALEKKIAEKNKKTIEKDTKNIQYANGGFPINIGSQRFDVTLETADGPASLKIYSNKNKLTKYTRENVYRFKGDNYDIDLSFIQTTDGLMITAKSNTRADLRLNFKLPKYEKIVSRVIDSDVGDIKTIPQLPKTLRANESMYLDTEKYSVKISKVEKLVDIGSKAYEVDDYYKNADVLKLGFDTVISIPISAEPGKIISTSAFISDKRLVNWASMQELDKIKKLDIKQDNAHYHFMADGVYNQMPSTYMTEKNITSKNAIYKSAAAWILSFRMYGNNVSNIFDIITKKTMYDYLDSYTNSGYIPTPPIALWLLNEYHIGYNFYDTRFNTDTVMKLMNIGKIYPKEDRVKQMVQRYANFYLNFVQTHNFYSNGSLYVQDYATSNQAPTKAHCSLNHYLMEGIALIEMGEFLNNPVITSQGYDILNNIERNYKIWIKPNGDLWYGISKSGEMFNNDYLTVTYNDLYYILSSLRNRNKVQNYPGLKQLYISKTNWLITNNHYGLLKYPEPY